MRCGTVRFLGLLWAAGISLVCQAGIDENRVQLDRYLQALVDHDRMMLSVAVAREGDVVYTWAGGYASVEAGQALTPATRMRIGSISKSFAATLLMQAVESGHLSLDATLDGFYPRIPNAGRITLRQMLNHRSGIANFTDLPDYPGYMTRPQSREVMVERITALQPEFEPGERFAYSNSNYYLLGGVIEQVAGKPFADLLAERIAQPLGLSATGYGGPIRVEDGEARSYAWVNEAWQLAPETDMSIPHAAGAVVSTPSDLVRFITALFADKVVGAGSLAAMTQLHDNYGFGLIAFPFYEHRFIGHNGGIDGFVSNVAYNPQDGYAIAVLANGVNFGFNEVLIAVLNAVYDRPIEIPDLAAKPVGLEAQDLQALVGNFTSSALPLEIRVFLEGSQLMAQATGQGAFPLTAFSESEFRFEAAGIVMRFDRASEPLSFILAQGGAQFTYTRKPG